LRSRPRIDRRTTAIFASVPGGAAEMSVLGERFGARVDRVASAQSLRIVIVVTTVPTAYALLACTRRPVRPGIATFSPPGFALLMRRRQSPVSSRLRCDCRTLSCSARSPSPFR
jgi:uncharacterized membrane protein AbrB (regulator of aidB expression)